MTSDPRSPLGVCVAEFNALFDQYVADEPSSALPPEVFELRKRLLVEEFKELLEAMESGDLEAIAKEAADVAYVLRGTTDAYGFDLDDAVEAVHRSNLSKLVDGKPIKDAGGKTLKGPHYVLADMTPVLRPRVA